MVSTLRPLEACDPSSNAQADVKYALERYQGSTPINYLGAAYGEMVASGWLARLRDGELDEMIDLQRDRLFAARRAMQSVEQSLVTLRRYPAQH